MATTKENEEFADLILEQWPLDVAIDYITRKMSPDDVFEERDLDAWAIGNGYIKEEKI